MTALTSLLISAALGAVIGWLASMIMNSSLSLLWCLVLGVAGSLIGDALLSLLGLHGSLGMSILFSVIGSCLLLWLARMLRRA